MMPPTTGSDGPTQNDMGRGHTTHDTKRESLLAQGHIRVLVFMNGIFAVSHCCPILFLFCVVRYWHDVWRGGPRGSDIQGSWDVRGPTGILYRVWANQCPTDGVPQPWDSPTIASLKSQLRVAVGVAPKLYEAPHAKRSILYLRTELDTHATPNTVQ